MKIEGTFRQGKMYRGNGRWAKVMESQFTTVPKISIAFGVCEHVADIEVCASPAKSCFDFDLKAGYRKSLDGSARSYIETGEIDV